MALRGKKPEAVVKRLKLFMYSAAGVGKTTAAIQFPKCYVIDCERGTEQAGYAKRIIEAGGSVFQTTELSEVITEVKSLLTTKHDFHTLVIDPITTVYNDQLEKSERMVGSDFGRHYGAANKEMKRLYNLLMALDMNIVMTAHAKKEYGDNLKVTGMTFDGWRGLDYAFDLVIELQKHQKKRMGRVVKTRIETFPDGEEFEWSYDAIRQRYAADVLERDAKVVALASPEQVKELKNLLEFVRLPEGTTDRWLAKANVETWEDMPADAIDKCIVHVKSKLPAIETAA
jgi:hypothetical protein